MGSTVFRTFTAIACLAATGLPLFSGQIVTVELLNGDRITGELLETEGERIALGSEFLGMVQIDKAQVANLEQVLPLPLPATEPPSPALIATSSPAASSEPEPVGMSMWDYLRWVALPDWEKQVAFGWTSQAGRQDVSDAQLRFGMSREQEENQYRLQAEYRAAQTDSVATADRMNADFRWRRDLSSAYFYQSVSSYGYDQIKRIDQNLEQKLGLGARIVESDALTLSAGAGATGRWREYASEPEDINYLVDVFQDMDYRFSENLSLKQDFRFALPLEHEDGFEYTFSTTITSNVTESLNLSVRYELDYDKTLAQPDRLGRRLVSALGFRF